MCQRECVSENVSACKQKNVWHPSDHARIQLIAVCITSVDWCKLATVESIETLMGHESPTLQTFTLDPSEGSDRGSDLVPGPGLCRG